jgi:hypothetical protein
MAVEDIPVFREARRGQVLRSADWNAVQQEQRNAVRAHRHTRPAGQPADDTADDDIAGQIGTDEIAGDSVRLRQLAPEVREAIRGRSATALRTVAPGDRTRVEHGLGRTPVAVVLGVRRPVAGIDGVFEVYGATGERVHAAVPVDPDGTFVLVSDADTETEIRWWAFAGRA